MNEDAIQQFYGDIGRRVKDARSKYGMTQSELAIDLSMTRSSIANLESGRQRAPLHVLAIISEALGISLRDLIPESSYLRGRGSAEDIDGEIDYEDDSVRQFVRQALQSSRTVIES